MKKLAIFLMTMLATTQALAIDTILRVPHGSTSVVIPCIVLLDIGETVAGAIAETGITSAEAGLEVNVRGDVTAGWHANHVTATINAIGGTIGQFETPDANDVHFEEVAASTGCYQLILPDSYFALDDGGTSCGGAACDAKVLQIQIRDTTTPAFRDTWVQIELNIEDSATVVDLIADEPCSGHTTAGTIGETWCSDIPAVLVDTGTTLPASLSALTAVSGRSYVWIAAFDAITSQTQFDVDPADDPGATDAHVGEWLCVEDADDSSTQDCKRITGYNTTTDIWTIESAMDFTVAVGDTGWIPAATNSLLGTDEITATVIQASAIGASELAADAVDEIWDEVLEDQGSTYTARCLAAALLSYSAGAWSRTGDVVTYQDPSGAATRIVGTIGSPGFSTVTITCP